MGQRLIGLDPKESLRVQSEVPEHRQFAWNLRRLESCSRDGRSIRRSSGHRQVDHLVESNLGRLGPSVGENERRYDPVELPQRIARNDAQAQHGLGFDLQRSSGSRFFERTGVPLSNAAPERDQCAQREGKDPG